MMNSQAASPSTQTPASAATNRSTTALLLPAAHGEQAGRALAGAALIALVFAAWAVHLGPVAEWSLRELRVLPALSVLLLSTFVALFIQGGRLSARILVCSGLAAASLLLVIQYVHRPVSAWMDSMPLVETPAVTEEHAQPHTESNENPPPSDVPATAKP